MNLRRYIQLAAAGLIFTTGCVFAAEAGATNTATAQGFDQFKILADRNIFNPNRSGRSARRDSQPSRPAPVVRSLALVGTMSYQKGTFAFFDGSSSEFRKPVKEGDKIAGYEVKAIQPSSVTIASEKQEFELKVGQQLRREDEGEWQLSAAPRTISPPSETSAAGSGAPSTGNVSEDEALKRLMEKRAKELNP